MFQGYVEKFLEKCLGNDLIAMFTDNLFTIKGKLIANHMRLKAFSGHLTFWRNKIKISKTNREA